MKREIKFRIWLPTISKMTYPASIEEISKWCPPENTSTLMQYAGLKDRNGADIYEGDEVACYIDGKKVGAIDEVRFKNGAFCLLRRNIPMCYWEAEQNGELEVIGNIHQQR